MVAMEQGQQQGPKAGPSGDAEASMPPAATEGLARRLSSLEQQILAVLRRAARACLELVSPVDKYQRLLRELKAVDTNLFTENGLRAAVQAQVVAARPQKQGSNQQSSDFRTRGGRHAAEKVASLLLEYLASDWECWESASDSLKSLVGASSWQETLERLSGPPRSATVGAIMESMGHCLAATKRMQSEIAQPHDFPLLEMVEAVKSFDQAAANLMKVHRTLLADEGREAAPPAATLLQTPRQAFGRLVDHCVGQADLKDFHSRFLAFIDGSWDEIEDCCDLEKVNEGFLEFLADATEAVTRLTEAVDALQETFHRLEQTSAVLPYEQHLGSKDPAAASNLDVARLMRQFRSTENSCLSLAVSLLNNQLNDRRQVQAAAPEDVEGRFWQPVHEIDTVERHLVNTQRAVSDLVDYMTECYRAMQLLGDAVMPLEAALAGQQSAEGQSSPRRSLDLSPVCEAFAEAVATATPRPAPGEAYQQTFFDMMSEALTNPLSQPVEFRRWDPILSVLRSAAEALVEQLGDLGQLEGPVTDVSARLLVNMAITEAARATID